MTRPNDQAYPVSQDQRGGLTIRELFAAMAMQGLGNAMGMTSTLVARCAVETADAIIAELNKEQNT